MGLEITKAKAYAAHERKGLSGIMHKTASPIAIAANMLCKHTPRIILPGCSQIKKLTLNFLLEFQPRK